ncbi:TatD family hydrolase [Paenibacillus sp. ACRRX]|uniref:TatD family hydrolase n=1 Tax=Paenibacillus sp. ACRRX TaxID=2918206 RepID=UPI001EF525B9|nr:TatD family hydrolase [Paenibacillus sp. ACRRX]MCG7408104.1 TatD family hydrolase [Paenibacillus sp. ACRRX]
MPSTDMNTKRFTVPRYVDTHIHLDMYDADMASAFMSGLGTTAGVEYVVAVSMHLGSCKATELLALASSRVLPAYGYHPEQELPSDEELAALLRWMDQRQSQMCAIGEVGLPYYRREEALTKGEKFHREPYIELLEPFVKRAAAWNKPIVLHAVYDDAPIVCDMLEQHNVRKAHFHWFKGDDNTIQRMAANGYYVSLTPDLLYETEIQQLAARYPLGQVMTETDGPWPFDGPFAGHSTEPGMVRSVAAHWAVLHGLSDVEAAEILYNNAKRLYGF